MGSRRKEEIPPKLSAPGACPLIITLSGTPCPWKACPGGYSIDHFALGPGKSRPRGIHPRVITLPGRGHQPPADGIRADPKQSAVGTGNLTFTETSDFGFFEAAHRQTILLTTQNYPSGAKPSVRPAVQSSTWARLIHSMPDNTSLSLMKGAIIPLQIWMITTWCFT